MKIRLLYPDSGSVSGKNLTDNEKDCILDLQMEALIRKISGNDETMRCCFEDILSCPLKEKSFIRYRQDVLRDCMRNRDVVQELYGKLKDMTGMQKRESFRFGPLQSVTEQFSLAVTRMEILQEALSDLRIFASSNAGRFQSEGFSALFRDILENLDEDYFRDSSCLLKQLRFADGMKIRSRLGDTGRCFGEELLENGKNPENGKNIFSFRLDRTDEKGAADLRHREEIALSGISRILVQAVSYVCDYLDLFLKELSFYAGCLHLLGALESAGIPCCIPEISGNGEKKLSQLYEAGCCFSPCPVGNDFSTDRSLCLITGADPGGKTTFLRSLGQAQLMMQCGMFVIAKSAALPVTDGIYTHFQREEDHELANGKLGEELSRMHRIAEEITPGSLILMDESFCSTNEKEGSAIGIDVIRAFRKENIDVRMVTHLFLLCEYFEGHKEYPCLFLHAQRLPDGTRTKKILPGGPDRTSYSLDLYSELFG